MTNCERLVEKVRKYDNIYTSTSVLQKRQKKENRVIIVSRFLA